MYGNFYGDSDAEFLQDGDCLERVKKMSRTGDQRSICKIRHMAGYLFPRAGSHRSQRSKLPESLLLWDFDECLEGHNVLKDMNIVSLGRIAPCSVASLIPRCSQRGFDYLMY